jgi:GTP-binding protein
VYEGQVVGEHGRDKDMVVNVTDPKPLTNMRASGSDAKAVLKPPTRFSMEMALEFIEDDELVEITPKSIRMRKVYLKENERKKHDRQRA